MSRGGNENIGMYAVEGEIWSRLTWSCAVPIGHYLSVPSTLSAPFHSIMHIGKRVSNMGDGGRVCYQFYRLVESRQKRIGTCMSTDTLT
jgi:hypothetical protein